MQQKMNSQIQKNQKLGDNTQGHKPKSSVSMTPNDKTEETPSRENRETTRSTR